MRYQNYLVWMLLFAFGSCVEPVEFDDDSPQGFLVVDGSVVANAAKHTVKLGRGGPLGKRVFERVSGARLTLIQGNEERAGFIEVGEGEYELSAEEIPGVVGESYHLEIELLNGKKYRTDPEIIPQAVVIDSISFDVLIEDFVNDLGNVINRKIVKIFVNTTLPDFNDGPYLRWRLKDVYRVQERLCGPMPQTCYIRPPDFTPPIKLVNGDNFNPDLPIREELAWRNINYAFGERYSFSVTQVSQTESALDYWTKVDQIVSLDGSIFDIAPAPIRGNVFNVDDPEEMVLGYFSSIATDTSHLFMTRFDVASVETVSPFCGIPGFPLGYFPLECCNCLELKYSSYDRPDFW